MCSYVEKCAEFKNQTLKKIGWYTKNAMRNGISGGGGGGGGVAISQISTEMGYPIPHNLISPTLHPNKTFALVPNNVF